MLPPDVAVSVVQLPGRGARLREAPVLRMDVLADAVVEALREEPELPTVLFGHSLGALIGFEVVRRALAAPGNATVVALAVAAHKAPQLGSSGIPDEEATAEGLLGLIESLGGTPGEALSDPQIRRMLLPVLQADFELDRNYRYAEGPTLGLPLHVFGGRLDPLVTEPELEAWRSQAGDEYRLRWFPGDHFFLTGADAPALLADLAELLRAHS